ncbi:hypothetical protein Tco_0143493 [Tanacetum coccineum]
MSARYLLNETNSSKRSGIERLRQELCVSLCASGQGGLGVVLVQCKCVKLTCDEDVKKDTGLITDDDEDQPIALMVSA